MNSLLKKLTAFFTRTSPDNPIPSPLPILKFWEISSPKDNVQFLQLLSELLPLGSTLYLEGTTIAEDVKAYLKARPARPEMAIPRGTIWPKPQCFHMPITTENTAGLIDLSEHHAEPEICSHLHAYHNGQMYLFWYDAFFAGPKEFLYLSQKIPEWKIEEFCEKLGCTFTDFQVKADPSFLFETLPRSS